MNVQETAAVLAYMQSAWPYATIAEETATMWASRLVGVDPVDGKAAADALIDSSERFPSIAEYKNAVRDAIRRRTGSVEGYTEPAHAELEEEAFSSAQQGQTEVQKLLANTRAKITALEGQQHRHGGPNPCGICGGIKPGRLSRSEQKTERAQ